MRQRILRRRIRIKPNLPHLFFPVRQFLCVYVFFAFFPPVQFYVQPVIPVPRSLIIENFLDFPDNMLYIRGNANIGSRIICYTQVNKEHS